MTGPRVGAGVASTWLSERVEASPRTLGLALGDAAMIALFVAAGELRHGGTLAAGVETFAQFGVGWLLASVAAGAYGPGALATPRRALLQVVGAWVVAALVGQLVRALVTPGGSVAPAFVVVSVVVGSLLLGAWRYAAARASA